MSNRTIRTCDICHNDIAINQYYINAGTYGADFHVVCARSIDFLSFVKLLNLDEIKFMVNEDWNDSRKLISFNHISDIN